MSPVSPDERLEDVQQIVRCLEIEGCGRRGESDVDRDRILREDAEQGLVRPVVAGREDEVPRLPREVSREVRAFVHAPAANLDDLVAREDLGGDVDRQVRQYVN